MKKYFAAAAVAVMVFAFSAFAASLTVNDSTLAAGQGDVSSCAESANVTYDHRSTDGLFWVTEVFVDFNEGDCIGNTMYLAITDVGGVVVDIDDNSLSIPVTPAEDEVAEFTYFDTTGFPVEDLNDVNITVFSDPAPGNDGQITGESGYGIAFGAFAGLWDGPSLPE